jgi:hypothetical protein
MREDALILYWALLASVGLGGATYVALAWAHAQRGIRGAALLTALLCAFVVAACFAGLHSHPAPWALFWLAAVERAAWGPLLLALLVLVDLYAADNNGHRAITTILYLRWERLRARRG